MSDLKRQYYRDGYVIMKGFFDRDRLGRVRQDAKRVFITQMARHSVLKDSDPGEPEFEQAMIRFFNEDLEAFINCGKQTQWLPSLHALGTDERLIAQARALGVGFPCIGTRPVLFFNCKKLAKQEIYYKYPAHQDWRSMQGSLNAMVVWVPLAHIPSELGPLQVLPHSHLDGLNDEIVDEYVRGVSRIKGIEDKTFITPTIELGDALFFSAFLIHRSGNNVTDSIRWSCHLRYNDLSERTFMVRNYPDPFIYEPKRLKMQRGLASSEALEETFGV